MTRLNKAEVALENPDDVATFGPSLDTHSLFDRWKGAATITLGGAGLIAAAMLVGWLMERLAG